MAWIESHTILIRHRKLIELSKDLRLKPVYTMGHLHALWHAALEQQEDGDLSSWSDELIAEMASYSGDAPQFVRLLQQHKWLDGKIIHDWLDFVGKYLTTKYRTSNPKRLKEIYKIHKSGFRQTKVRPKTDNLILPDPILPDLLSPDPKLPNRPEKEKKEILSGEPDTPAYEAVTDCLNEILGTHYLSTTKETRKLIKARWEDGFRLQDFREVIEKKARSWLHDPKMAQYLRPETLFGPKFQSYLNEKSSASFTAKTAGNLEAARQFMEGQT